MFVGWVKMIGLVVNCDNSSQCNRYISVSVNMAEISKVNLVCAGDVQWQLLSFTEVVYWDSLVFLIVLKIDKSSLFGDIVSL